MSGRQDLAAKHCIPCHGGSPRLSREESEGLLAILEGHWRLDPTGHLRARFDFPDFADALGFAVELGDLAEAEGHHPELHVGWGHCDVEIWTHAIDGLTESDFVLAAKVDRALKARQ